MLVLFFCYFQREEKKKSNSGWECRLPRRDYKELYSIFISISKNKKREKKEGYENRFF